MIGWERVFHGIKMPKMCVFFKNEKLILWTVSHERICLVFPPLDNSSFEKEIQNILSGWISGDDLEEEKIDLRKI